MSRSRHTAPLRILAPRQLLDSFGPRSRGDSTEAHAALRGLKERGVVPLPAEDLRVRSGSGRDIRIRVVQPRPGFHHPVTAADVREVLEALGARWTYGLRLVSLTHGRHMVGGRLFFGERRIPGDILLYEQPESPWRLPGALSALARDRLLAAGAQVASEAGGLQTLVHWPDETLRDFMLRDVLTHELAHHAHQQCTGKRNVRLRRTHDHEAQAEVMVRRLRDVAISGAKAESSR